MRVPKKPRRTYFYATLGAIAFSTYAFFISYSMANNLIEKPDILYYARGGVDGIGIFISILFAIMAGANAICFIKNKAYLYCTAKKLEKIIIYLSGFIVLIMPVSGYILTNKIKDNGYIKCESRPYSITYAKTEQACKQYKSRRHPYRKYEDQ